jgi:hypothetical protein
LLLLCLALTTNAHAEDASARAFRRFGLEGVWSPDCRLPPSEDNPRVVWRLPDNGPVFHGVTFDGTTWALIDTVADAVILQENLIRYSAVRNGEVVLTATIERVGERIRTTTSIGANGEIYYADGREAITGKLSMSDQRCDVPVPIS